MSIALTDVTRHFGVLAAVDGLTALVETGQFFTVLGPSGCGKSTLLRLIAGLEPLDAGRIALNGRPVAGPGLDLPPEARGLGVVFQSYALWPHLDVLGNVAFPIEAAGRRRQAARAEAEAHLASVALQGLGTRRPADLSGGQRQRVALARCLAGRARVVLMDEPLANLDPHLRAAMEEELAAFHRTSGATTLYITHDQREAMALGDRIAVMNQGRFEQIGTPEDIHDRPATAFVGRFVGRGAVLPVDVLAIAGGRARLGLAGAEIEAAAPPGLSPGPANLLLRPKDVAPDPDGLPTVARGSTYRGGEWEIRLALAGMPEADPLVLLQTGRPPAGPPPNLRVLGGWVIPGRAPAESDPP
ncbi:ABC transporter ATP-binding protein [Chthonobacter rhizosphaerae]|uniref:ABC transporter ATP-binding protein n=1 Tax=Chthonobacter rhizosphaerae TaxID=2735553 RepID=UPI0015EEFD45|nr:ABC transporter ATP-binding protein [Chthonobacter rhizosphaerae]